MAEASHYYFEALPVHPHPEYLESLTSYLTLLAEINGLSSMRSLAAVCFPGQNVETISRLEDYRPFSFGTLPIATRCPLSALLATTFFYLGRKFERHRLSQSFSHFLSAVSARSLRYCPQCIAECPYYRLTWRFLFLSGCARHHNVLLDTCGHCGYSIPIFTSPFRIGFCPHCRGDLRLCWAANLTTEEFKSTVNYTHELEFLLSHQPLETYVNLENVDAYLADLRQKKPLTAVEVANFIETTRQGAGAVEYEYIGSIGSPIKRYVRYTQFLLNDILDTHHCVFCRTRPLKAVTHQWLLPERSVQIPEEADSREWNDYPTGGTHGLHNEDTGFSDPVWEWDV